ncbi:MAG: DUF4837 family protein [Mucinivorans sp.]
MKKLFFALVAAVLLTSCGTGIYEIAATGKPYEVLVVADRNIWNGATGDTIRSMMSQEVDWVNQPEPIFDLLSMAPQGLNELMRRHRNMILIKIDQKVDSTSLIASFDRWATGQVVMDVTSPSDSAAAQYMSQNGKTLVAWLEKLERDRMSERGKKYNDSKLTELVRQKFGFTMFIPQGYRLRNDTTNFLWISYEMPLASQGLAIYTFPRVNGKFDPLARRNEAVALIPGPSNGSYMATDTIFKPELSSFNINGRDWSEIRGFWNVKNDFMGGPFINYVTYDSLNNRYIAIDMYVLSPSVKYPKRNYIRQLESLMMNVKVN